HAYPVFTHGAGMPRRRAHVLTALFTIAPGVRVPVPHERTVETPTPSSAASAATPPARSAISRQGEGSVVERLMTASTARRASPSARTDHRTSCRGLAARTRSRCHPPHDLRDLVRSEPFGPISPPGGMVGSADRLGRV